MDANEIWNWLKYFISGGAGVALSQLYDSYIRGRKESKDSQNEVVKTANETNDRFIAFTRDQDAAERAFRDELRSEMSVLRGRIVTLEQELKMANERYYEVLEENAKVKAQYEIAMKEINILRNELQKVKVE